MPAVSERQRKAAAPAASFREAKRWGRPARYAEKKIESLNEKRKKSMTAPEIKIVELPVKCRKCVMRRHRVGLVKECEYECPAEVTMLELSK